jgi:protein tyrosine/serine phosphatase
VGLASPRGDLPGLSNFAKISDGLWRGAQPDARGFAELKRMGVKTVVNLRTSSSDREALAGLGLDYLELPIEPQDLEVDEVVTFLKVATDPGRQPVFVHCKHGADRTGTVVAMYRIVEQGWPREKALSELDRFGFHEIWANLRIFIHGVDLADVRQKVQAARPPAVERVE